MDDIITYIVVFGLILIGIIIWQFRYAKPRPFWLSFQIYPDLKLWVQVEKKDGKHKSLIIRCEIKPENYIKLPYIELIDKKREKIKIEIPKETEGIIEKTKNKRRI